MEPVFKIQGIKEIQKALESIDKKFAKKITRTALRKGIKEVATEVKATAPKGETGQLKKQIKVRSAKRSRSKIGINIETTSPDNFYGQFVELGTSKTPATHWQRKEAQELVDNLIRWHLWADLRKDADTRRKIDTNLRSVTLANVAGYQIVQSSNTGEWLQSWKQVVGAAVLKKLLAEQDAENAYGSFVSD